MRIGCIAIFSWILTLKPAIQPPRWPLRLFSLPKYFAHYFLHLLALSFYLKIWKEKVLHRFFFILKLCSQKLLSDALLYLKQVQFSICKVPRCMKYLLLKAFPSHINSTLLDFVVIFMILFLFMGLTFNSNELQRKAMSTLFSRPLFCTSFT